MQVTCKPYLHSDGSVVPIIKQLVKTDKWRMVSDNDAVLKAAIKKNFVEEIGQGKLHYFVNTFDKTLSKEDAFQEFIEVNKYLREWAKFNNLEKLSEHEQAVEYMK